LLSFLAFLSAINKVNGAPVYVATAYCALSLAGASQLYIKMDTSQLNGTWEFFEDEVGREIAGLAILASGMALIALTGQPHVKSSSNSKRSSPTLVSLIMWCSFLLTIGAFYGNNQS
jgi:hypothetical protein